MLCHGRRRHQTQKQQSQAREHASKNPGSNTGTDLNVLGFPSALVSLHQEQPGQSQQSYDSTLRSSSQDFRCHNIIPCARLHVHVHKNKQMFLASIAFGSGSTHPLAPRYDISFELFQVMEATNTDRDTAQRYTQRVQVQHPEL